MRLRCLAFVSFALIFQSAYTPPPSLSRTSREIEAAGAKRIHEQYGRLPLRFETNEGQTDSRVAFLS
jgi:hypothetical protein